MRSRSVDGWGLVLAAVLLLACLPSPPESRWVENGLAVGQRMSQTLEPETVHVVLLQLSQPSFLSAVLEQVGSDLELVLRGPEGEVLISVNGSGGSVEFLATRTERPGAHRLEVRSPSGKGGDYVLELSALREGREGDEVRVEGWKELQTAHHLGKTDRAREGFETALEHFRRSPDPIGEAYALQHLGWVDYRRDGPQAAIARYDEALTRLTEPMAPAVRAGLLADRASALLALQRLREARDHFLQALELWRQAGDEVNRTETLNSLGKVLNELGELNEAEQILSEVLELRQAQGDFAGELRTRSILGTVYSARGDLSQALEAHQRTLEGSRETQNRALEFRSLVNLGAVLRTLAEPQAALRRFDEALELRSDVRDPAALRSLMSHLGLARAEIGDPAAAIPSFEQALELAVTPDEKARTLLNWGWAEDDLQRRDAALELYDRALELDPSEVSPEVRILLQVARARAFRRQGRLSEAQSAITKADAEASRSTVDDPINRWLERGEIARMQGRRDEARNDLERALKATRTWGFAAQEAVALVRLGQLARDEERFTEAREFLEEALELHESLRAQVTSSNLRASYLSLRLDGFEAYLDLLVELDHRRPEEGWKERAFAASERMRARTLDEILTRGLNDPGRDMPPELVRRKRRAVDNLQRVQRLLQSGGGEALHAELDRWQQELERIQWQIDDSSPQNIGASEAPMTLERAQNVLPQDAVLLEYAQGVERTFLFVVTRESLHLKILPPYSEIERPIGDLVEALSEPSRRLRSHRQQLSRRLFDVLITPVNELLRDADRLLIVPMGALHYLPFEALWDGQGYLMSRWAVSYVPSAAVLEGLAGMKPVSTEPMNFVAFADPTPYAGWNTGSMAPASKLTSSGAINAIRGGELRRLPGAQAEVQAIAEILAGGDARLYMGPDATETQLKANPDVRHARWLHIASHGFLEDRAGFSSLYLAHEPDSPEDGLLQVHEIRNLELTADLVVLSACETGLGSMVRGEGLVGLSRAFLSAGAHSLVVSLWRVEDRSTADLMVAFYRRLYQGEYPARALQEAKLQMLSEDNSWAEPYHWAPFVLIGGL